MWGFCPPFFIFVLAVPGFTAQVNSSAKEIYTPAGVMVVVIIDVIVDVIWRRLLSIGKDKGIKILFV